MFVLKRKLLACRSAKQCWRNVSPFWHWTWRGRRPSWRRSSRRWRSEQLQRLTRQLQDHLLLRAERLLRLPRLPRHFGINPAQWWLWKFWNLRLGELISLNLLGSKKQFRSLSDARHVFPMNSVLDLQLPALLRPHRFSTGFTGSSGSSGSLISSVWAQRCRAQINKRSWLLCHRSQKILVSGPCFLNVSSQH